MNNIDKQWLQQKIADMEAASDEIPFGLNEDDSNTLAALRIALASLEAEPVGWFVKRKYMHSHPAFKGQPNAFPLFTAPPAPVSVPDMATPKSMRAIFCQLDDSECAIAADVWNACRAAMLQGAAGNSPAIPDGLRLALSNAGIAAPESDEMLAATCDKHIHELVAWVKDRKPFRSAVIPDGWVACSERMPKKGEEVLCTDQFENYETALYDTGYMPGPPFFATAAGEFHPTHWMPLPAAPQQGS